MGGRIWAKRRPEGGAEFGFSLPAYPDEPEPVDEPGSDAASKPASIGVPQTA
jgi:hypothetical protein